MLPAQLAKAEPDLLYNVPSKEPDEFGLTARDLDVLATTTIQGECKAFADDTPFAISGTALSWWLEAAQQKRYPIPSQMAINILSITSNVIQTRANLPRSSVINILGQS